MDYEKAYKEALQRADTLTEKYGGRDFAEYVFPELADSEDERIRKFLVKHVSEWIGCIEHDLKLSSKDVESEEKLAMFKAGLAYLEKQKINTEGDFGRGYDCGYEACLNSHGAEWFEKQLLLKDLCARLPYETWVQYEGKEWLVTGYGHGRVSLLPGAFSSVGGPCPLVEEVRPYLRPMSSMTDEEEKERNNIALFHSGNIASVPTYIDFLNKHHFDYRGLIEKGLALEAPEGMYKTE